MIAFFAGVLRAQEPGGVIEGRMRDAITRAPVAAGQISLHGAGARSGASTQDGGFRCDRLPAGGYTLTIEKAGYLDATRGLEPRAIQLKAGVVTESVIADDQRIAIPVDIPAGARLRNVNLRLRRPRPTAHAGTGGKDRLEHVRLRSAQTEGGAAAIGRGAPRRNSRRISR